MKMKPFGLLGGKLGHSFSPLIHARFGSYEYRLFETPPEQLDSFLKSGSFAGLNVTIPYKKAVLPYCTTLSPLAERIGSVNTVRADGDDLHGYNTDYFGFIQMLAEANISVKGEKCVVIGAGGASATVCVALQDLGAETVTVIPHKENTRERIAELADHRILVNTSPVGMYPNNGQTPVDIAQLPDLRGVADLIFNPLKTALLLQAEERSIPHTCGLTMLVAQAKQSAEIFQNKQLPDGQIQAVTQEIRKQCENILLIGMPGSGKSEIGKRLAACMNRPFFDTDTEIVKRAGRSIPDIFSSDGEQVFRKWETEVLAELTARSGCVIATGGGIIKKKENLPLLRQNGTVFFLERDIHTLPRGGRPLSSSPQAVEALYRERLPLYLAACDHRLDNNGAPAQTVENALLILA